MTHATAHHLSSDECWQLLRQHDVARIFFRVGDLTHVIVVSHAVVGGTVFFRTVEDTHVLPALLGREVTLELDEHHDTGSRCVVLRGVALRVDQPGDALADLEILPISVTGRRLVPATQQAVACS